MTATTSQLPLPDDFPIEKIVEELRGVPGLVAIVLGGSRAAGRARPDSDVDLGLYYRAAAPLDIDAVRAVAERVNDTPNPIVTPLGGWGRWVNGGAWLEIGGLHTDFLYRDLDFVTAIVGETLTGQARRENRADFWQQAPYGFHPQIYCAEIQTCLPLYDPEGVIPPLKATVATYPEAGKRQRISGWLWGAGFTLTGVKQAPERGDAYLTAGYLTRACTEMIQALYALNEVWFMNDKYVYQQIAEFRLVPPDFMARVDAICGGSTAPAVLRCRVDDAKALHAELLALAGDLYTPRY